MMHPTFLAALVATVVCSPLFAQKFDPPAAKTPDAKTLELIKQRTSKLEEALKALPANTPEYMRSDVEIYHKAAEWIVRHGEWFHADSGKWTLAILDQGMQRAADAAKGKAPWREPAGKTVSFGFRSIVDGSIQPCAVTYPLDYGKDPKKRWRLDIVLHGRDSTICEVKFLYQHNGKAAAKDQDYVQLEIYGRGNNAYRWAGERDVIEAMENFIFDEKRQNRDLIDRSRVILRGFSMGGAGTWHIGLQHPSYFCAIGPGAGFTTTHGYIKGLPNPLPPYQEPLLHIYDAVDYAENAFNVPIVAYSGEIDPQKAAADHIEKRLKELKINTMTHLVAPGLAHQFPADWQRKAHVEFAKYVASGRPAYPERVQFITYTLKFPGCDWLWLEKLEKHYEKAQAKCEFREDTIKIETRNVKALSVLPDPKLRHLIIDGDKIDNSTVVSGQNTFEKKNGRWVVATNADRAELWKRPRLCGPIDDAFHLPFVCVRGTATPWHDSSSKSVEAQLERFEKEWDKWMRGKLLIKSDKEVTEDDIKSKHLILFGDPASNSLIGKTLPKLPITWDKEQLVVGGQEYESSEHLPMLIYPNPLNLKKYIVLNSGHTFHEADFKGTNALLYPRLGDYAVVRPTPTEKAPAAFEVIKAGIFDDSWKIAEK